ncbi:hypothetical protein SY83_20625 [Paenibacillus swuensis]|uniref:DUF1499 domain-containing protein n=1 Tax=Paenibacillus swuensis TaxID=1178515 RepID=A0A172TPW0_9BACL|nr:DUF1499 domain-containing protein [Paenibacillus swuensis]ANE49078.1 hypothetical protein SY83_20625 [Paenibacillus swuensis]
MLKRALIGLIRSHESTGEKVKDPLLKTRYYRMSKEQFWEEVISAVKKMPGYKVLHEVKSVGEIVLEKRTVTGRVQDITLTLITITPSKSAIDVYSASRGSLGDLGSNYRTILDIHAALDRKMKDYKTSE